MSIKCWLAILNCLYLRIWRVNQLNETVRKYLKAALNVIVWQIISVEIQSDWEQSGNRVVTQTTVWKQTDSHFISPDSLLSHGESTWTQICGNCDWLTNKKYRRSRCTRGNEKIKSFFLSQRHRPSSTNFFLRQMFLMPRALQWPWKNLPESL